MTKGRVAERESIRREAEGLRAVGLELELPDSSLLYLERGGGAPVREHETRT